MCPCDDDDDDEGTRGHFTTDDSCLTMLSAENPPHKNNVRIEYIPAHCTPPPPPNKPRRGGRRRWLGWAGTCRRRERGRVGVDGGEGEHEEEEEEEGGHGGDMESLLAIRLRERERERGRGGWRKGVFFSPFFFLFLRGSGGVVDCCWCKVGD